MSALEAQGFKVVTLDRNNSDSPAAPVAAATPRMPGEENFPDQKAKVPLIIPPTGEDQSSFKGATTPGTIGLVIQNSIPGAAPIAVLGQFAGIPKYGEGVPGGGTNPIWESVTTLAEEKYNQPIPGGVFEKPPLTEETRGGVTVTTPNFSQPFIPSNHNHKPHYRRSYEDIGRPWEQYKNIPTSKTPFSQVISPQMISQLPGQIMSFVNAFKGLSGSQVQRIKDSVPDGLYNTIESVFNSASDPAGTSQFTSTHRVHPETFANNLVDLLCTCTSYPDVIAVKQRLGYDVTLHGHENLPEVEFNIDSAFGEVGLIISPNGDARPNVSNAVAEASEAFFDFMADGSEYARFFGTIANTTLTVVDMDFGEIKRGKKYQITAANTLIANTVTEGTFVQKFLTGEGETGTYEVNLPSNTPPNTEFVITRINTGEGGSGSGGGGGSSFPGMIPGQNMFGDAARLVAEVIPVLNPEAQKKITKLMKDIQTVGSAKSVIASHIDLSSAKYAALKLLGKG